MGLGNGSFGDEMVGWEVGSSGGWGRTMEPAALSSSIERSKAQIRHKVHGRMDTENSRGSKAHRNGPDLPVLGNRNGVSLQREAC